MPVTSFKELEAADRDLLAGLFYRVGVWIGQAEDVDGEEDDRLEAHAIRRILDSLAGSGTFGAFVQAAARQTLDSGERWPQWAEDTFDILPDVARARAILARSLVKAERDRVVAALCEVAAGVAEAYGEFAGDEEVSEGFLSRIMGRIRDRIAGVESGSMNVSPAESAALEELETTLRSGAPH